MVLSSGIQRHLGCLSSPYPNDRQYPSIDELVSMQEYRFLSSTSLHPATFGKTYFRNFHKSLPIIDKDTFYCQLEKPISDSHFFLLLLSVLLVIQLSPQPADTVENPDDLYHNLKRLFSLIQSTGRVSISSSKPVY
jgi:hypothetical protein